MAEYIPAGSQPDRILICENIVDVRLAVLGDDLSWLWTEWLNDPTRLGWYFFNRLHVGEDGDLLRFRFSDPDVAFEFKMRWA